MYSAGNSISSLELRSLVCFLMKSYCANPSCGKPIIVSTIGRPVGIPIAGTSACDGNGMNCSATDGQGNSECGGPVRSSGPDGYEVRPAVRERPPHLGCFLSVG